MEGVIYFLFFVTLSTTFPGPSQGAIITGKNTESVTTISEINNSSTTTVSPLQEKSRKIMEGGTAKFTRHLLPFFSSKKAGDKSKQQLVLVKKVVGKPDHLVMSELARYAPRSLDTLGLGGMVGFYGNDGVLPVPNSLDHLYLPDMKLKDYGKPFELNGISHSPSNGLGPLTAAAPLSSYAGHYGYRPNYNFHENSIDSNFHESRRPTLIHEPSDAEGHVGNMGHFPLPPRSEDKGNDEAIGERFGHLPEDSPRVEDDGGFSGIFDLANLVNSNAFPMLGGMAGNTPSDFPRDLPPNGGRGNGRHFNRGRHPSRHPHRAYDDDEDERADFSYRGEKGPGRGGRYNSERNQRPQPPRNHFDQPHRFPSHGDDRRHSQRHHNSPHHHSFSGHAPFRRPGHGSDDDDDGPRYGGYRDGQRQSHRFAPPRPKDSSNQPPKAPEPSTEHPEPHRDSGYFDPGSDSEDFDYEERRRPSFHDDDVDDNSSDFHYDDRDGESYNKNPHQNQHFNPQRQGQGHSSSPQNKPPKSNHNNHQAPGFDDEYYNYNSAEAEKQNEVDYSSNKPEGNFPNHLNRIPNGFGEFYALNNS